MSDWPSVQLFLYSLSIFPFSFLRGSPDIVSKEQPRPPRPSPKEAQIAAASAAMARVESMQEKGRSQSKNVDKIHANEHLPQLLLLRYLNNIIENPNEEKYCAVRISNKIFQEKINCLEGSLEFFEAVGFEKKTLPLPGQDVEDEFYVLSSEALKNLNDLQGYRDSLLSGKPIRATLERQPRIFAPSLQATRFSLTDDFYNLTVQEIKQQHQLRKEKLEQESVLQTKAMRGREEKLKMKKYKYTVLRVRFPDGYLLQGTFHAQEWLSTLFDFVCQHLQNNWLPYDLLGPCGQKLENKQITFLDCGLVPSALLTFCWDVDVLADVEATTGHKAKSALKEELISIAEILD
ncbi:PREDICTED: UBX domain-containing protein 6-like [Nanorana parkeri]|uniref:UBX domain-containing protein 6-like n=1 Tax=Nanorana parkeri TaxID=125878 RepID=UPI000854BFCF|nr:PREDICTED: UBX domain-containing protein 6-like [Nanorana parkeri]